MPEAVTTTKVERTVPTLTIDTGNGEVETLGLPAEEKWGFRLTGGSDFGMPVTIFQVSRANCEADEAPILYFHVCCAIN